MERRIIVLFTALCLSSQLVWAEGDDVSFQHGDGNVQIAIDGQSVAEYVFHDDQILRPYFRHLRTPSGVQVTRNHPPVKGRDLDDHATMHPGLWLAFGDLDGADFWRNKGRVRHVRFVEKPSGRQGTGSFTVRNIYEADGRAICTEDCEITVSVRSEGWLMDWSSTFRSKESDFTFGDQEEMGLGVRMATPLAVVKGGTITDSEGRKDGAQVWGKQADWCEYGGVLDGQRVGVVLMPHLKNFRRSWFHARDYGLLAANPFGRNAFTKGEKSRITVKRGDEFRLRFGVLVYGVPKDKSPPISSVYREYVTDPQIGTDAKPFHNVECEGSYRHHLQGICTNDKDAIYWSFTTTLVKTDTNGKLIKKIEVKNHHGDLCHHDGNIYAAVNFGRFNDPDGKADNWIYVYDADDLSFVSKHKTPEVFHGAGGIRYREGRFFVVGGLPDGVPENYVYEYDDDFKFVKKHVIKSGHTRLGVQTAAFAHGKWFFGCYGNPKILLVTDGDFNLKGRYEFDCSLGIVGLPNGQLLSASGRCEKEKGCTGSARLVVPDDKRGLRFVDEQKPVEDD